MPVNIFDAACKTESNKAIFGLCDKPDPAKEPAYIDEDTKDDWIGIVNNPQEKNAKFYAIDHCVNVLRADGKDEKRCDGILTYSNDLILVELKSREGGRWLKGGREQLTATYNTLINNCDITIYDNISAYVCNSLRPMAHSGQAENIERFKDDTGLILKGEREINI